MYTRVIWPQWPRGWTKQPLFERVSRSATPRAVTERRMNERPHQHNGGCIMGVCRFAVDLHLTKLEFSGSSSRISIIHATHMHFLCRTVAYLDLYGRGKWCVWMWGSTNNRIWVYNRKISQTHVCQHNNFRRKEAVKMQSGWNVQEDTHRELLRETSLTVRSIPTTLMLWNELSNKQPELGWKRTNRFV